MINQETTPNLLRQGSPGSALAYPLSHSVHCTSSDTPIQCLQLASPPEIAVLQPAVETEIHSVNKDLE